jgi:uncharacterized membrane protein YedE/YeeE
VAINLQAPHPRPASASGIREQPAPYLNPYLAGVGIGLVLLAAFVIIGRGLGASGAFSTVVASGARAVDSGYAPGNAFFDDYATVAPWRDWLVVEVIGITLGAFVSALIARRTGFSIERGPRISDRRRLLYAFVGGSIMGIGAKLARGCTSGLGLTGGALLSVGSWIFVLTAFAAAYALAPLLKRAWR